jgi:hypothetical protein
MAQSLDIYIDTTSGILVSRGAVRDRALPTLTRNDSYNFRIRLQERDQDGFLRDLDTSGSSIKLGIGNIDGDPTDGQFRLVLNSITSSAISFNASPLQVYNAISGIAGTGVTVTTYGQEQFSYLITSPTLGTAMSFGGDAFTLFPTSSVLVNTRRFPNASVAAQQVIRLVRNPAVYSDTFTTSPTAGIVSLTKIQDGSSSQNETYSLAIGSDAEGGSVVLNFGSNSTTAIPIGSTAASFQEALTSITAIGAGNINVDVGNNAGNYSITFVRNLGLTNITTALALDASGVIFGNFLQTTVTMATAELDELFAETGTDTIAPKIEIELSQGGTPKTVLQSDVTVRRDLITTGSVVPAAQASYLTATEIYAAFLRNSTTGFNSTITARRIISSDGATKITASTVGLGFFTTSPVAQPSNTNVVSALVNLGLIANTVTVGVTDTPLNVVTDWTGNVSATTRFLADSSAVTSVDWGNRVLKNSTGVTSVNWETGTFGSGSTVVTIASNNVAISGSYYIAMGTENGAFRTLSTTASVSFGAVASNDQHYRDVVVTGAAINDIVLIGLPSAVSAGAVIQGVAYKTNTVCLSCSNSDNGTINLNTATYRITVLNYQ